VSTLQIIGLVATILASGGFSSVVVELLKRNKQLPKQAVLALVAVVSALVGLAVMWATGSTLDLVNRWGDLTAQDVWLYLGGVYTAALACYETLVRRLGISSK
jgi:membrane glycosyltransferase